MKTLFMKIHQFEEQSHSLIVSFASDTTKYQDPDKYPSYAYQPLHMWPDIDNPEEIKKRIAMSGMYHAEQQEREEKFVADQEKIEKYRDMIGQVSSYPIESLASTNPHEVVIEV